MILDRSRNGAASIEPWRWGIVWLMFLATLLNYMDRQTLISVAKTIKDEFRLGEEGYGWIEFWFGISYGLFQLPAGYLADRLNLRWLYVGALLVWSAAGFLTGLTQTMVMLAACRIMLGLGEAFNWPCAVGIVRRLIPLESRGFANGIFHSGASIGAVLTPLLAVAVLGSQGEGWRQLFMGVGALGVVWAGLWFALVRGTWAVEIARPSDLAARAESATSTTDLSLRQVFLLRSFWVTLGVGIAVNICWHFYRTWLTRFLDVDMHFDQQKIQYVLAGFFLAADLGSLASGYMTRRLTYWGYSVLRSRQLVLLGAACLCLLSTPAALLRDVSPTATLILIFVVSAGSMAGFPIFFALSQEVSPRHTSFCLGIFGSVAWLFIAIINPPVGRWVDRIGTFQDALIVVGCLPLVGAMIGFCWPDTARPAKIVS
jgi:ACS family hexuronate transporter-like MFS transporter